MDTQILLNKLTQAVTFKFKEDKTAPGITLSCLKKGFYCSVVRYDGAFAKGKQVVCSARGDTLEQAIQAVAKEFVTSVKAQPDPLQELDILVRSNQ